MDKEVIQRARELLYDLTHVDNDWKCCVDRPGAVDQITKALRAAYADGLDSKATVDQEAGAGYVYLTEIKDGEAVEQIRMEEKDLIFDFNKAGELIGIEFLDLAVMPQAIRQQAQEVERWKALQQRIEAGYAASIAQLQDALAAMTAERDEARAEQAVLDGKYVDERSSRIKSEGETDQYFKCLQIEKHEHATALRERDVARQQLATSQARVRELSEAITSILTAIDEGLSQDDIALACRTVHQLYQQVMGLPKPFTWVTDKPKVAGWYLYGENNDVFMANVWVIGTTVRVQIQDDQAVDATTLSGKFAGPIPLPQGETA